MFFTVCTASDEHTNARAYWLLIFGVVGIAPVVVMGFTHPTEFVAPAYQKDFRWVVW
jgi:hypothetical protein